MRFEIAPATGAAVDPLEVLRPAYGDQMSRRTPSSTGRTYRPRSTRAAARHWTAATASGRKSLGDAGGAGVSGTASSGVPIGTLTEQRQVHGTSGPLGAAGTAGQRAGADPSGSFGQQSVGA